MDIFMFVSIVLAIAVSYLLNKNKKLKNTIEYKEGELYLLKRSYDITNGKYYDMINSDKCKKCEGRL